MAQPMPKPPSSNVMLAIRVPAEWIAEADDLVRVLSTPGLQLSRTDIFRQAIETGLGKLRAKAAKKPTK